MDNLAFYFIFALLLGALRLVITLSYYKISYGDEFLCKYMFKRYDIFFEKKLENKYKNMLENELREHLIVLAGDIEQHKLVPFYGTVMTIFYGMLSTGLGNVIGLFSKDDLSNFWILLFFVLGIQLLIMVHVVSKIVSHNAIQKNVIEYVLKCRECNLIP